MTLDIITKLIHLHKYLHSGLSILELEVSILPLKSSSIHMNDWGWSFHYCWHQKWDRHVGYVFLGSSVFAGECSEISICEISMYGNKSWKYLNRKYWIPKYCHRSFARIKQRRKLKKLQMNILPDYAGNLLSCKLYTAVIGFNKKNWKHFGFSRNRASFPPKNNFSSNGRA